MNILLNFSSKDELVDLLELLPHLSKRSFDHKHVAHSIPLSLNPD